VEWSWTRRSRGAPEWVRVARTETGIDFARKAGQVEEKDKVFVLVVVDHVD